MKRNKSKKVPSGSASSKKLKDPQIEELIDKIKQHYSAIIECEHKSTLSAIRTGARLLKLRNLIKKRKGNSVNFKKTVRKETGIPAETAFRYMRIARKIFPKQAKFLASLGIVRLDRLAGPSFRGKKIIDILTENRIELPDGNYLDDQFRKDVDKLIANTKKQAKSQGKDNTDSNVTTRNPISATVQFNDIAPKVKEIVDKILEEQIAHEVDKKKLNSLGFALHKLKLKLKQATLQ